MWVLLELRQYCVVAVFKHLTKKRLLNAKSLELDLKNCNLPGVNDAIFDRPRSNSQDFDV